MALLLKINTVDVSEIIQWQSLTKDEALTKAPDSLTFQILQTGAKTIPSFGDTVELFEDSIKIFSGIITERAEKIAGGLVVAWVITCKDWNQTLDRTLVAKTYINMDASDIIKEIVDNYTLGFTYANVPSSMGLISSVKFNYLPVSQCFQKIADYLGWDWYVDYDKDVNFISDLYQDAPFEINDTEGNFEWKTLTFDRNILELVNSVIVRGGEYPRTILEADAIDVYVAQDQQTTFQLAYKYGDVQIKLNGVSQTVGIDNIDDPLSFDLLYNFTEKFITFTTPLTAGDTVVIFGNAYTPVIAQVRDNASITAYGEYQSIVIDKNIVSVVEAQARGKVELLKWAEGAYAGQFKTLRTGLSTGMRITINSTIRGVNETFKINRIQGRTRTGNQMEYTVNFLASGQLTFQDVIINLLGKDKQQIEISSDEVVERLESIVDSFAIADATPSTSFNSPPYYYGAASANPGVVGFSTWT